MPKVDKLDNLEPLHTEKKFGQEPRTAYKSQLTSIQVTPVHMPTIEQFRQTISMFLMNTWNDEIETEFDDADIDRTIDQLFKFELLPTAMETINLTFSISGMDMIDTTHLIRHRLFSFSAQVHGDRDMRHDSVMVKPSIMVNEKFFKRYDEICKLSKDLYCDMMDSGEVNGLDARTIMPRCFEHFYFARGTIKDWIAYVQMRLDEQIQTQADNIIALQVWYQIVKAYPFLKKFVNLNAPDAFYVKQCKQGKTNIFPPNKKNDLFDWVPEQFYHDKPRDEYPGGNLYLEEKAHWHKMIESIE